VHIGVEFIEVRVDVNLSHLQSCGLFPFLQSQAPTEKWLEPVFSEII